MSFNPFTSIKKTINAMQDAFDYVAGSPPLIAVLIVMTIFVLPIPLTFLTHPAMYGNEPEATMAFPRWPIVNNLLLVAHIAAALPAILIGPFMFIEKLRRDHLDLHRSLGKIYVTGCMVSAITVLPLAMANVTPPAHIGFTCMGLLWFTITFFAYSAAINRDIVAHRRWMMRSYAMTFAFIHVNLTYKGLLPYEMFTMSGIQVFKSMVSWQFNLLLVEIYLAATTHTGRFVGMKRFFKHATTYSRFDQFYFRFTRTAS